MQQVLQKSIKIQVKKNAAVAFFMRRVVLPFYIDVWIILVSYKAKVHGERHVITSSTNGCSSMATGGTQNYSLTECALKGNSPASISNCNIKLHYKIL